jgi:hypothetical protein
MTFKATLAHVKNRGVPPTAFLQELVEWGRTAPEQIFAPNTNPADIYAAIVGDLGPWTGPLHRRAAMLEAMCVHAGFESSWNWNEGVDTTNKTSMANETGQETGIFQVSFDSEWIAHSFMKPFAILSGIDTVDKFIPLMKSDHELALSYYARLVRISVKWAGPILRREINPWLSRDAVKEFGTLLTTRRD